MNPCSLEESKIAIRETHDGGIKVSSNAVIKISVTLHHCHIYSVCNIICVKNDAERAGRIACHQQDRLDRRPTIAFIKLCQGCSRDCKSRIGLYSHTTRCSPKNPNGAIS